MVLFAKLFIPVRYTFQEAMKNEGWHPLQEPALNGYFLYLENFISKQSKNNSTQFIVSPFKGRGLSAVIVSAFNPFRAFDGQPCFSISADRGEVGACVQDFDSIPIL